MQNKSYFVYLLLIENGSYYCGYTDNTEKRFQKHLSGKGAKYTRANKPLKIAWQKRFDSKSTAMKIEKRIKKLSHEQKILLIENKLPQSIFELTTK
ncbi:MAG: GIY-YIG nuclease family protein [Candidatus Gastranaerophilaceae bacterium]